VETTVVPRNSNIVEFAAWGSTSLAGMYNLDAAFYDSSFRPKLCPHSRNLATELERIAT
jgi:hypothetical protein